MSYRDMNAAIKAAYTKAKTKGREYHIFREEGEYHLATDRAADEFWLGQSPLLTVTPEGEVLTP